MADSRMNQVWRYNVSTSDFTEFATYLNFYSATADIKWSAHLNLTVGADGLRVELVPAVVETEFHNGEVKCVSATEAELAGAKKTWGVLYRQVQEEFPSKVDFGSLMSGLKKTLSEFWKSLHIEASTFIDAGFAFARNGTFSLNTHLKLVEARVEAQTKHEEDEEDEEDESELFDERDSDGIRVRGFTSKILSKTQSAIPLLIFFFLKGQRILGMTSSPITTRCMQETARKARSRLACMRNWRRALRHPRSTTAACSP